jgi:protoporphyrinogen oxidase
VNYGIAGGGVLGLTAALRLAQRGHQVTVYERDATMGGLAGSFEVDDGVWLEKFYHHLFRTDRRAIALIEELGLGERLRWHRPVTTVLRDGEIRQLDSPMSVLRFEPLGLPSRLRLAAGLAILKLLPTPAVLEGHSAGRWMRRVMGEPAYRVVWEPLLRGKFGESAGDVSMPWLWARIHCRSAELGYLDGGFHLLYTALAERVRSLGGTLVPGADVRAICRRDGGVAVDLADGGGAVHERVISTLPTALTAKVALDLPDSWRRAHPLPKALGAHCLVLSLDRPLTDVYWIGVNDPGYPFLAVVEHTRMLRPEAYGGRHLVYLGNYRPHDDPLFRMSTAEVIDAFLPGIQRLNPAFDRSWIKESWSFGAPFAQPVVTRGFKDSIPGFDTPVPGLFVATMFQVYPHDRGQNYSIRLAERLVDHLERPA